MFHGPRCIMGASLVNYVPTTSLETWVFLGVAETIVSSLLCCGVGIVQGLFNLLYYVIGVRNNKKPPET